MDSIRKATRSAVWGITDALVYFIAAMFIINVLLNFFDVGLDPTDKNGFNRSGLNYYKDYGTGVEYIGNGECIIPRPTTATETE